MQRGQATLTPDESATLDPHTPQNSGVGSARYGRRLTETTAPRHGTTRTAAHRPGGSSRPGGRSTDATHTRAAPTGTRQLPWAAQPNSLPGERLERREAGITSWQRGKPAPRRS